MRKFLAVVILMVTLAGVSEAKGHRSGGGGRHHVNVKFTM